MTVLYLRRTYLINRFANVISEHDVITMMGHVLLVIMSRFYMAVHKALLDRTRKVASTTLKSNFVAFPLQPRNENETSKSCSL
jgi:hypothetical protein